MGLHRPDESFGMVEIDGLTCSWCDCPPSTLSAWAREGTPGAAWACEDHIERLSGSGHPTWIVRRTCQAVDNDVPCGKVAEWIEIVSAAGKVQPGSLCRDHAERGLD